MAARILSCPLRCYVHTHRASLSRLLLNSCHHPRRYVSQFISKTQSVSHVIGVETTCDDTGIAIVSNTGAVLASDVVSQWHLQKQYGGVYPDMAAKHHQETIDTLYSSVLSASGLSESSISAVCVAAGPGLAPCLSVGMSWSADLAKRLNCPFVGVNHLHAHAFVAQLSAPELRFPFVTALVTGAHTEFWCVRSYTDIDVLGVARDDAVGEALDKAARMLKLLVHEGESFGRALERVADTAQHMERPDSLRGIELPIPMIHHDGCDLSFAGLKTALLSLIRQIRPASSAEAASSLSAAEMAHLAADFQRAAFQQVVTRGMKAMKWVRQRYQVDQLVLCGGVACNQLLRSMFNAELNKIHCNLLRPPPGQCRDNGEMIAWLGVIHLQLGHTDPLDLRYTPRMPAGEKVDTNTRGKSLPQKGKTLSIPLSPPAVAAAQPQAMLVKAS